MRFGDLQICLQKIGGGGLEVFRYHRENIVIIMILTKEVEEKISLLH